MPDGHIRGVVRRGDNKEKANWVNKDVAFAKSKDPPSFPYLAPNLTETPRMPPESDHAAARTKWAAYSKQARRSGLPQELRIHAFTLYQLRFVCAADLR